MLRCISSYLKTGPHQQIGRGLASAPPTQILPGLFLYEEFGCDEKVPPLLPKLRKWKQGGLLYDTSLHNRSLIYDTFEIWLMK